jgi:MFS family permease
VIDDDDLLGFEELCRQCSAPDHVVGDLPAGVAIHLRVADFFGYDATGAALLLTYVGVLGTVNQGVLIGRLARRFGASRVVLAGVASLFVSLVLPAFGALVSFGNGSRTIGLSTLVSERSSAETQGIAFGVTRGAGSLGRTVGPPLAAAAYVLVYRSPFVAVFSLSFRP